MGSTCTANCSTGFRFLSRLQWSTNLLNTQPAEVVSVPDRTMNLSVPPVMDRTSGFATMNFMTGSLKTFIFENDSEVLDNVKDGPKIPTIYIGIIKILEVLGMFLSMLTRILLLLTPLAVIGFSLIQIMVIFTIYIPSKEFKIFQMNIVLLVLAIFVAIKRWSLFA